MNVLIEITIVIQMKSDHAIPPQGSVPAPPHWHNANARHPDVLKAQRRGRACIRTERGIRWGGRPLPAAA